MADQVVRARRNAIRAEYAEEEAEAAELEALENAQAEQSVLSVRMPAYLVDALKERAAAADIPTSALVRRILTQVVQRGPDTPVTTRAEVEEIARRVVREESTKS